MLLNRVFRASLLVGTWDTSISFRSCALPLQEQRNQLRIRVQHLQHENYQSTFIPPTATWRTRTSARRGAAICPLLVVATTPTDGEHPRQYQRIGDFARTGETVAGGKRGVLQETRQTCTADTKNSGAINYLRGASLTRSQALASTLLLAFATGSWGPTALAEDAIAGSSSDAVRALREPPVEGVESEVEAAGSATYVLGSDEIGVFFGGGPIGIKLGDNPLKASGVCRTYVPEVLQGSQAIRQAGLRAGLGVAAVAGTAAEKLEPKEVAELIRVSKRPLEIVFRDPELLGRRLQAEADKKAAALRRTKQKAAEENAVLPTTASSESSGELRVTQVGKKPTVCGTRTKAGDLIEFRYSARLASDLSVEFDSSDRRGTGLPYAIVLGNGDVLKGLDLSLFDMCVGERRRIEIPARLAYGRKGSKVFGIPADDGLGSADVVFGVELVSINFRSNPSDQRDNFYTGDPCDAAAVAAGNASGKCPK